MKSRYKSVWSLFLVLNKMGFGSYLASPLSFDMETTKLVPFILLVRVIRGHLLVRQVLHKFVKVLDKAILRIDKEHAFAANRMVQKNLALLNGFSEANRNVERLNAILKELQVYISKAYLTYLSTVHLFHCNYAVVASNFSPVIIGYVPVL